MEKKKGKGKRKKLAIDFAALKKERVEGLGVRETAGEGGYSALRSERPVALQMLRLFSRKDQSGQHLPSLRQGDPRMEKFSLAAGRARRGDGAALFEVCS